MDQQRLHQLERQCIQSEPAACVAACPLHVDARAMVAAAARGDLTEARRILAHAVPFPRAIARCCDAPCEVACVRGEVGGAIRVGELERAAVTYGEGAAAAAARRREKRGRVAVVGAGLCGLGAALDLARKGYAVTVFDEREGPGGRARDVAGDVLPPADLEADCAVVTAAGAELVLATRVELERGGAATVLQALAPGFDALLLATGSGTADSGRALGLAVDEEGRVITDPVTFATSEAGVYAAGGLLRPSAPWSPVTSIAEGRRAAISIDRQLQGVSLGASRGDRGAYETRLVVDLEGVPPVPPLAPDDPRHGYTREEAAAEAGRCLQCECLQCVRVCPYLEAYGGYPGEYARRIYNNLTVTRGRGTRKANKMIDSCSLCRLCFEVCPTDLDMAEVIREARREMVRQDRMPASAFGFALRDLELAVDESSSLARHAPGTDTSEAVFFPGCQLSASDPAHVERAYAHLRERYSPHTGLVLHCCGAPADWAGRGALFDETLDGLRELLEGLGSPRVILACPTCQTVFGSRMPEVETVSLWEVLRETGLPEGAAGAGAGRRVAVHDACTARYQPDVQRAARELVEACGYQVDELELTRERTTCCGFGGLMLYADHEMADRVVERRVAEGDADYVAYCAMCRDRFAARGKRALHLLDLVFAEPYDRRAERRGPGLTQRSEERAALKRRLLAAVWHEGEGAGPHWRDDLVLSPEVEELLEERCIRPEEAHQVILRAEATGDRFVEPATGHRLASLTIGCVTYWVEYSPADGRSVVHSAYSHRMQVKPPPWPAAETLDWDDGRVWRCGRGDHELEPRTVTLSYLVAGIPAALPACPRHGLVLIPEFLATGRMLQVELALEDK